MKFYNILHTNMYNMDEKAFRMGVALRCKVICRKHRRSPKMTQDCSPEWVTGIETVSGDGRVFRPMIINTGKVHYMSWYAKLKKHHLATIGVSEKGWTNEELELRWLNVVFDVETRER